MLGQCCCLLVYACFFLSMVVVDLLVVFGVFVLVVDFAVLGAVCSVVGRGIAGR